MPVSLNHLRCALCALLVAAASADPAANNDLLSSSARFGGHSRHFHGSALHQLRPQKLYHGPPPADAIPAPAFATTEDEASSSECRMSIGRAVAKAVLVIAAVVLSQTLGDNEALPRLMRVALIAWQRTRGQWPLLVATVSALCLYGASDVLSQCAVAMSRHRTPPLPAASLAAVHHQTAARSRHGVPQASAAAVAAPPCSAATVALDLRRMLRTGSTAALLSGFLAVFYFAWLEKALGSPALSEWARVAGKIAIDVGVYEPCYDTLYITLQTLLRGEGLAVAQREVARKVLPVWKMAPRYWIAADLINFGLMPLRLRPMCNALFSIPWGMYISSVANAA